MTKSSTVLAPSDLKQWVDEMRKLGIVHLEGPGLVLTLAPEAPVTASREEKREPVFVSPTFGLTEEEQLDLYNTVVESATERL